MVLVSRWSGLASISRFVNARYLKPWKIERQTFRRIVNDPRKTTTKRQTDGQSRELDVGRSEGKPKRGEEAFWGRGEGGRERERSRARTRAFGSKSITGGKPFCGNVNNYRAAIKIRSLFPFPVSPPPPPLSLPRSWLNSN